jgi:hypothetical protein
MPIQSAVAYSENVDEPFEAGVEIGESIRQQLVFKDKSVGVMFCNIDFDLAALLRGIATKIDIPIIGCTTGNEANNYGYFEESASLVVITGDNLQVGLGMGTALDQDLGAAAHQAYTAARAMLGDHPPKLALIFPDSTISRISGDKVIHLIEAELGAGIPVVGGVPCDNLRFQQTFQFCQGSVQSHALPILLLGGDIDPVVVTRSGWLPVGEQARATRTSGTVLYEINGRPALEYIRRYIPNAEDINVYITYPLALIDEATRPDGSQQFIIRAPIDVDEATGAITYLGDIPQGSLLRLARGTRADVLSGVADAIGTLKQRLANREVSTLFFFSCVSRRMALGLDTKKEIEMVMAQLGGASSVNGFYTYGEIGSIDSGGSLQAESKFHNSTLVLCAL